MELDELRRIAAREELSLNFVAKDEMITKALLAMQGFDDIILKGGTAINRVYLKNKRFSEDIDFDIIFKGTAKQALPRTKEIISHVTGFSVAKPRIMNETIRYDLSYTNPLGHKDKIRVEFRVSEKAGDYGKKVVNSGFVPSESALLNVYSIECMIRQKAACITGRMEGKDFYDLYYLMELPHERIRLNKEEVLKRITLEEKQIMAVANVINHYIPKGKRPDWRLFLEEMKEKIRKY